MPRRTTLPLLALAVLATVIPGCRRTQYDIDIEPIEDGFRRTTTAAEIVKDDRRSPGDDMLKALQEAFGVEPEIAPGGAASFSKLFETTMPNDVGGAGYLMTISSPVGKARVYTERLWGTDDMAALFRDDWEALDYNLRILAGWLESEVGRHRGWPQVRAFIEGELGGDLKTLLVYYWMAFNAINPPWDAQRESDAPWARRMALYLVERGYIERQDLIFDILQADNAMTLNNRWDEFLKAALASKAGLPEDAPVIRALEAFWAEGDIEASFEAYARTLPAWRRIEEAHRLDDDDDIDPPAPRIEDVLRSIQILGLFIDAPPLMPGTFRLRLACPVEPLDTNGQWNPGDKAIRWEGVSRHPGSLPSLAYAKWAEPNEAYQKNRFGRTALAGQQLLDYLTEYRRLSEAEQAEWDAFVDTLTPGPELRRSIDQFLFHQERQQDIPVLDRYETSRANPLRKRFLGALKDEE